MSQDDRYAPVPPEIAAQVREIMRRPYSKVITPLEKGGFHIHVPDLPGCQSVGDTEAEASENIKLAMLVWLETALMDGQPVPEPSGT